MTSVPVLGRAQLHSGAMTARTQPWLPRRRPPMLTGLALLALAFLVAPVLALLSASGPGVVRIFSSTPARDLILRSVLCASAATGFSLLVGLPLALFLLALPTKARKLARAAVMVPMVLPPVVGGVGLLLLFQPHGLLGRPLSALGIRIPFSTAGVVLAQLFVALPLLVLCVEAALRAVDPGVLDAGRALGMSTGVLTRRVLLPCARGGIAAGLVLAFTRALGEFGATVTLAGDLPGVTRTLPLAVYSQLATDPATAYALAGILICIAVITMVGLRDRWLGSPMSDAR